MIAIYFLIGLIYVVLNATVRKIDTDGDWLLALTWLFLWPLCFAALLVGWVIEIFEKHKL